MKVKLVATFVCSGRERDEGALIDAMDDALQAVDCLYVQDDDHDEEAEWTVTLERVIAAEAER
jgi:hypothetical protein